MSHESTPEGGRREAARDRGKSLTGKVFDTESNPIQARLLVWGPEEVDGEDCIIVEPTDFFWTAPNRHYHGQERPGIAADDLRIAIPVGLFPPSATRAALAEIAVLAEEGANGVLIESEKQRFDVIGEKARAAWTGSCGDDDAGDPDHCPRCGSGAIAQMTAPDGDWACLDCRREFFADDPDESEADPERADPSRDEGKEAMLDLAGRDRVLTAAALRTYGAIALEVGAGGAGREDGRRALELADLVNREDRKVDVDAEGSAEHVEAAARPRPETDDSNRSAGPGFGIASVHAHEPARRKALMGMRLDWLRSEGWDVQAGEYERDEVTLTELLRRLNDEPPVVEQIATWLEEDAAEGEPGESPYTVFGFHESGGESFVVDLAAVSRRHAEAKARAWARGLEDGGEIVVAAVSEACRP